MEGATDQDTMQNEEPEPLMSRDQNVEGNQAEQAVDEGSQGQEIAPKDAQSDQPSTTNFD